jgi:hypothetical protein
VSALKISDKNFYFTFDLFLDKLSNNATSVLQNIASLKRIFYYLGVQIEFNEYTGAIEGGGFYSIGVSVKY